MAPSITDLPKEVLALIALIFENLTKPNDRRHAAQVCKLFYEIVRHQSTLKHNNVLKLQKSAPQCVALVNSCPFECKRARIHEHNALWVILQKMTVTQRDHLNFVNKLKLKEPKHLSVLFIKKIKKIPIRVFENSKIFPFSKLDITNWIQDVILESGFWSLHGEKINEIILYGGLVHIGNVLPILNAYFLNLKKLTIVGGFSVPSDADYSQAIISLPIEEVVLDISDVSLEKSLTLLRCSPQLKKLKIGWVGSDHLPQILPWLEEIEISRVCFRFIPLEKLINLASKVVIDVLSINVVETPKTIREFFKRPRTIDTLFIQSVSGNGEFDEEVYFTRDQVMALGGAKSIKNVKLWNGILQFEGSLDLLATRLPGLESISLDRIGDEPNPLYPFYWSLQRTAQKIHQVANLITSNFHCFADLSSLTSISIWNDEDGETEPRVLSSDEIQTLIRNCPNLKKLELPTIDATDADLIGHGDLLPFGSLEKLKFLDIESAPNITSEAFKSAFKFPNLKSFDLSNYNSSEEPFNQNVAKLFTQNCPNLERLIICNCSINEEGFDYLIRHPPYLRYIWIQLKGKGHSLSKYNVEELQQEFPYITIRIC